ncbi:H-2 class II histocompatibility antigen, A-U alpha chain-like [Chanos chanos]|uniref:H-2 class II histocompatibility antigen, A-U alpha chain-like n=1 Tax=Chanos chanos TaxID=29144 RepID=A0A6J2UN65_CHACN|nr:H-2 class II histocompatibility antigen, A-U alpha chain-like [Chanos chanos]
MYMFDQVVIEDWPAVDGASFKKTRHPDAGASRFVLATLSVSVRSTHEFGQIQACSDTDEDADELAYIYDNEGVVYVDFKSKRDINTLPDFVDQVEFPSLYNFAVKSVTICKNTEKLLNQVYKDLPEALEPPQSSIYPKNDVRLGVENTLICHVTGFFPPPVRVIWKRNEKNVTDRVTLSRYFPNSDGTMNMFSTLKISPMEGDIYSCTVKHKALQQPQTRVWDIEGSEQLSVSPTVLCAVGLTVGLLGVFTGTFFLVKGNNS